MSVKTQESQKPELSPQELVQFLESLPPLDKETWDEFDRSIAEARGSVNIKGVFNDLVGSSNDSKSAIEEFKFQ